MGNSTCCSKVSTTTTTTFDVREKRNSRKDAVKDLSSNLILEKTP